MKNTPLQVFLLLFSFALLTGSCSKSVHSSVLEQHEETYPDLKKKYVYQSLIRLANVTQDPNFEMLIKDVQKIVVYLPPANDSTYQVKTVRDGMMGEDYELLMEGRSAEDMRMSLWVKDLGSRSHYIALIEAVDQDMILEVDGQINIEYLMALEVADHEALMGLIEQGF